MGTQAVFPLGSSPLHQIRPDLLGTVCEGEGVTLVRWDIPPDRPATPIHHHTEHEQFTIVVSGAIETTVDGEVLVLRPGDMCRIDRNVSHGKTRAMDGVNAVVVDVFSPPRAEYVAASRRETRAEA